MNYSEAIAKLFACKPKNKTRGLETMQALLALVDHPERNLKCVHVAGTNGKGSTVTKIAAALRLDGQKVGIYTSPHINSFCERVVVGNAQICQEKVLEILSLLFERAESATLAPTFFEYATALAFCYFAEEKVDIAVLETGIGGRLDATNVCQPILSVITSISLDHTEQLGTTVEAIAYEKAGIIKPKIPCIIGPRVPQEVVFAEARKRAAPVIVAKGPYTNFEEENQLVAKWALEALGVSAKAISQGLQELPPCRFQYVTSRVILDVAHNPDGLTRLFERIDEPVTILSGFSKDKDIDACLEILAKKSDALFFIEAETERAVSAESLVLRAKKGQAFSDRQEGIIQAFDHATGVGQILVVCGTFYIMSQVEQFLRFQGANGSR